MLVAAQSKISQKAVSGLLNALLALGKYAIVRYVFRDDTEPKLCCLVPYKGKTYECFWMSELPTSESIRDYQFNPLKPSSGEQQAAVGQLIDAMDLTALTDE